jgi:DNA-binding NtrC family response regulator
MRKRYVHDFLALIGFDLARDWIFQFGRNGSMARILLAESDPRIRKFFAGILADCGHAVETCANAVEATVSLATQPIDVVVSDLILKAGDETGLGRDCAALGIPTVTLSGRKYRPGQSLSERPPALLEKPFRFDDLQTVLDAVALLSTAA